MSGGVLEAFSLDQLEALRDRYEARQDRARADQCRAAIERKGAVQTEEMARSGKLFSRVIQLDDSGCNMRPAIMFTGDPAAWMTHFMSGARVGRICVEECTGANSVGAKELAATKGK